MTYIQMSHRHKYIQCIEQLVRCFGEAKDETGRADALSYFVEILIQKSVGFSWSVNLLVHDDYASKIHELATKIDTLLSAESDLFKHAEELNYVLCAVIWGATGSAIGVPEASYGFTALMKGTLQRTIDMVSAGGLMRRSKVVVGVLMDVLNEFYRKQTVNWLERGRLSYGDLYPLREVCWHEHVDVIVQDPDLEWKIPPTPRNENNEVQVNS